VKLGWPAEDVAGYVDGERHAISLKTDWEAREYQTHAADGFWHGGSGRRCFAMWRRQNTRWCIGHVPGAGDDIDLGY